MAEVQPPPVILYPHNPDRPHNNGAGHYSESGSVIRPIEPPQQRPNPPVPGPAVRVETSESGVSR